MSDTDPGPTTVLERSPSTKSQASAPVAPSKTPLSATVVVQDEAKEKEKEKEDDEEESTKTMSNSSRTGLDPRIINEEAFEQIQMCDEEGDKTFSRSIVFKYFEQAEETLPKLKTLMEKREMKPLSETGHFLKSSSAVLGIQKVREACEKIQHYAQMKDLKGAPLPHDQAVELLIPTVASIEEMYQEAKSHLLTIYKE